MRSLQGMLVVGLLLLGTVAQAGDWAPGYRTALKLAQESGKPILVIIDEPSNQDAKLQTVAFEKSSSSALAASFVLCRIDASTEYGQTMAKLFQAESTPFTAVVGADGRYQLFRHAGQFTPEAWQAMLVRFQTEPAAPPAAPPAATPPASTPEISIPSYSGGSCPSCQRRRFR